MNNHYFDVLVIGSGAAGLYAALCLNSSYRVGLVTKDKLKTGASDWAQGGIAAAINSDDSPQFHLEDTLKAGAGLCDRDAVQFLVSHGKDAIASLVDMGVAFDERPRVAERRKGTREFKNLSMTLEAAHSRPRVLHAADTTGRAIVSILTQQVLKRPNITVLSQAFALKLLLNQDTGSCQGVSIIYQQKICPIAASAVVLATGGGGQVFSQTTNPKVSTGDGVAIAWRSGTVLRDLEFVQFHPTALNAPGAPRFLISEAVRGEGAHLIDKKGKRFAFDYHPHGELAPRDVVSRAIFRHLQKTGADHVYLDLRPIPEAKIRYRFPNIIRNCQKWGVDIFQQPIPVTPAAHYWMGGIAVNTNSETSIKGLYAIGETASTGVHGANRLASNSLLECVVYAAELSKLKITPLNVKPTNQSQPAMEQNWQQDLKLINHIKEQLPDLIWHSAGISRTESTMSKALEQVNLWRTQLQELVCYQYIANLANTQQITLPSIDIEQYLRIYAESLNLVDVGRLILKCALFRQESRGGHYRLDFPDSSADWSSHTMIQGNNLHLDNS